MTKAKRKSPMINRSHSLLPGPNIYSPRDNSAKKAAPSFSMGKKIKVKQKTKQGALSPGPAAYKQTQNTSSQRSFS